MSDDRYVSLQIAYVSDRLVAALLHRDREKGATFPVAFRLSEDYHEVFARVPAEIAVKLLKQGTAYQIFSDGHEAAREAAPYIHRDAFYHHRISDKRKEKQ